MKLLRNPKFWYATAIIWAIMAAIGFIMLILSYSCSPLLSGLAGIFSVIGAIGPWLGILTGATIWGQEEMLRRQARGRMQYQCLGTPSSSSIIFLGNDMPKNS